MSGGGGDDDDDDGFGEAGQNTQRRLQAISLLRNSLL